MQRIQALSDGKPVTIGFEDSITVSPDGQHELMWKEEYEQPHSSSSDFEVTFGEHVFSHAARGADHAWSPQSDYFTLVNPGSLMGQLRVYRTVDLCWLLIPKANNVEELNYPRVRFLDWDDRTVVEHIIPEDANWQVAVPFVPPSPDPASSRGESSDSEPASDQEVEAKGAPSSWLGRLMSKLRS